MKYVKGRVKVRIVCPKHGVFEQKPEGHLQGQGCPICVNSQSAYHICYFYFKDVMEYMSARMNHFLLKKDFRDYTSKEEVNELYDYMKSEGCLIRAWRN